MILGRAWYSYLQLKNKAIELYYTVLPYVHLHNPIQTSLGKQGYRYYCSGCRALLNASGFVIQRNVLIRTLHTDDDNE